MKYVRETDAWKIDIFDDTKYLPLKQVYLGVCAAELISELPETTKQSVNEKCQNFYITLIVELRKRFQFEDDVYNYLDVLDPEHVMNLKTPSLRHIFQRFSQYLSDVNMAEVDKEWRGISLLSCEELGLTSNEIKNISCFWKKVFALENAADQKLHQNVEKVLSILLCLPSSNASVERIFSQRKLIKTNHRHKLKTDTIAALMVTKEGVGRSEDFEPSRASLIKKWK